MKCPNIVLGRSIDETLKQVPKSRDRLIARSLIKIAYKQGRLDAMSEVLQGLGLVVDDAGHVTRDS
jgi:hypothetical protein